MDLDNKLKMAYAYAQSDEQAAERYRNLGLDAGADLAELKAEAMDSLVDKLQGISALSAARDLLAQHLCDSIRDLFERGPCNSNSLSFNAGLQKAIEVVQEEISRFKP